MTEDEQQPSRDGFIAPLARYRGKFSPQKLAFNANLQEFAQQVSLLCNLETNGKVSSEEAYQEIKRIWKALKSSKQALIDNADSNPDSTEQDRPGPEA